MPLHSGEVFTGFTSVHLLGSGGKDEVYLAEHPRLPCRAALKIQYDASTGLPHVDVGPKQTMALCGQ